MKTAFSPTSSVIMLICPMSAAKFRLRLSMSELPALNVSSKLQGFMGMNRYAAATKAKAKMATKTVARRMARLLGGFSDAASVGAGVGGGYC